MNWPLKEYYSIFAWLSANILLVYLVQLNTILESMEKTARTMAPSIINVSSKVTLGVCISKPYLAIPLHIEF